MLEGLDKINWSQLTHAYGEASDVPGLIRALATANEEQRKKIWWTLYGNIYHQGTVYEATAYAVPFLVELLDAADTPDKHAYLQFLSHVAQGSSYLDVHQHIDWAYPAKERESDEFKTQLRQELDWVKAAHDAVYAHHAVYLRLLGSDSAIVRSSAAHLLSRFPEHDTELIPPLKTQFDRETDTGARSSMALAFGALIPPGEREQVGFLYAFLDPVYPPLLRYAAATSLARVERDHVRPEAIEEIIHMIEHEEPVNKEYLKTGWDELTEIGLYHVGREAIKPFMPRLTALLQKLPFYSKYSHSQVLFTLQFENKPLPPGMTAAQLTDEQRMVVSAIRKHALVHRSLFGSRLDINIAQLLKHYGLPDTPEGLDAFLNA